jgi:hypothetical protein
VLINAAYEMLSDPHKRTRYNEPTYTYVEPEVEEDPVEAYKREFKRKRREEEKRKKEQRLKWEMLLYKSMRFVCFPIFAFAILLVVDDFLPRVTYNEVAERGWQERRSGSRRHQGPLSSYIHTQHFTLSVPDNVVLEYPFTDDKKPPLKISATPIFRVPRDVSYTLNYTDNYFGIYGTIHAIPLPIPWLLLINSLIVVLNKRHSTLLWPICFLPPMILVYTLVYFIL